MTRSKNRPPILKTLLLIACAASSLSFAADPKQKADYEHRLSAVNALSEALARDPKSGTPDVKSTLGTMAARQKEAAELAGVGEYEAARMILDEGYKLLTKTLASLKGGTGYTGASGSAAATTAEADTTRSASAFDNRLASTKALRDTLKRLDAEKGQRNATLISGVDAKIAKAEAQRSVDPSAASAILDDAYNTIKVTLQQTQGGNTMLSGSAALEADKAAAAPNTESLGSEIERNLKSAQLLRDSINRLAREKNVDVGSTLNRLDTLTALAQQQRSTNPSAALQAAGEANQLAKDEVSRLRK